MECNSIKDFCSKLQKFSIGGAIYVLLDEVQLLGEFESVLNSLIRVKNVDVGVIVQYGTNEKGNSIRKQLEIDFVCNLGSKRYYIL